MSCPIAVNYTEDETALATYDTTVAEGCGEDLPALWGLDSLQQKDAVLLLRKGKRILALPGKGGYKIHWSKGTRLLPMESCPAGHLVVPCDGFASANSKPSQDAFITDYTI